MPPRFFGQFLLERGAIQREQLLDAVNYQHSINNPLCALAIEKGYLSREQLEMLDAEQQNSDKKFVRLAVEKRVLTMEQLEELTKLKSEKWIFLAEALVQRGHIGLARLQVLFDEYKKERQSAEGDLPLPPGALKEKEVIVALLKVTVDIFIHYTKQIVKVSSIEEKTTEPEDIAYTFSQKIVGDKNFYYLLALPESLTLAIASYILQQEVTQVDEMVLDAVSEFVNVIVGNGCAKMSIQDVRIKAEPPQVMPKEMLSKLRTPNSVTVVMRTMKGDFQVMFAFVE